MIEKIEKILGRKCKEIKGSIHSITEKGAYYKTKQGKIIGLAIVDFIRPDLSFLRELKSRGDVEGTQSQQLFFGGYLGVERFPPVGKTQFGKKYEKDKNKEKFGLCRPKHREDFKNLSLNSVLHRHFFFPFVESGRSCPIHDVGRAGLAIFWI